MAVPVKKALTSIVAAVKGRLPEAFHPYVDAFVKENRTTLERHVLTAMSRKAAAEQERRKHEAATRAAEELAAAESQAPKPEAAAATTDSRVIMVYETGDRHPNRLIIAPLAHLGSSWSSYINAASALSYKKQPGFFPAQGQEGSLVDVAVAVAALQRAGFEVRANSTKVAEMLSQGADQGNSRVREADEHLRRLMIRLPPNLKPRPYQVTGIRWLRATPAGALLDEMGLGKTMQWLLAAGDRAVVVCPASVKSVWKNEAKLWRPDLKPVVIDGRDSFRWPKKNEIVIVNYDIIRSDSFAVHVVSPGPDPRGTAAALKPMIVGKRTGASKIKAEAELAAALRPPFPTLLRDNLDYAEAETLRKTIESAGGSARIETTPGIESLGPAPEGTDLAADEGHVLKNPRTARHKAFKALAEAVSRAGGRRHLITATPIMNRPLELRGVLEAIGAFGSAFGSAKAFSRAFGGKEKDPDAEPTPEAAEALARISLRRLKSEVAKELPPKTYVTVPVELDDKSAAKLFAIEQALRPEAEAAEERARRTGASPEKVAAAIESALNKPGTIGQTASARRILAMAKLPASLDLIKRLESEGRPVLFLSAHSSVTDAFKQRRGWVVIDGAVTGKSKEVGKDGEFLTKREKIIADFQSGKLRGIAVTIGSGGVGLTLTEAADVVANDLEWNPAKNEQAYDRTHRIGQKKPVTVYVMTTSAWLEKRLHDLLRMKSEMTAAAIAPVAELGGQLPEGPKLETIAVGRPSDGQGDVVMARWIKVGDEWLINAPTEDLEAAMKSGGLIKVSTAKKGIVEVMLSGITTRGAGTYGVPSREQKSAGGLTDARLIARVRVLATDPDADPVAKWLLKRIEDSGSVPPSVRGVPVASVLDTLEAELPRRRREREREDQRYASAARAAKNDLERFAADALAVLVGLDPDRARKENEVGFSGATQDGHGLARKVAQFGGLTDSDWRRAVEIARIHHRQVGEAPA